MVGGNLQAGTQNMHSSSIKVNIPALSEISPGSTR